MDLLRERYLQVALSEVALPLLQAGAREITASQQEAASEANSVSTKELTAQEWFERGYVFQNDKNLEEAFRCYSEAVLLDPGLAVAYNNLGVLLKDLKRHDEAEAAYRKAIELDPSLAGAYTNLGLLLAKHLDRFDEAEAAFRKALELDPSGAPA